MPPKFPTILFVDNGTNYVLFLEIARLLGESRRAKIVFVTMIEKRVEFFEQSGVEAVYLDVSSTEPETYWLRAQELVSALEAAHPEFRLELGIKRDRILRFMPRSRARRILLAATERFSRLIERYEPALVLGEVSWAIEYLLYYYCSDKGIRYRHILNIPGESLRVAAFDDRHTYASALESSPISQHSSPEITKSYAELCGEVKSYKVSLSYFFENFGLNYSKNDYRQALLYRGRRLFYPAYKAINWLFYRVFSDSEPQSCTGNILFTLHIQPESTPDFVSPFFADQVKLAKELTEALRSDQILYVKDHPNTISFRNLFAWAQVLRHPQVRLLPREVSAKTLYERFDCVVSIAGTALLECSEIGVPALCFSDVYFKDLPGVFDARDFPSLAAALSSAVAYGATLSGNEREAGLLTNALGFPGFIHDARVSPQVLDPENIERLAQMIVHMVNCAGDRFPDSFAP